MFIWPMANLIVVFHFPFTCTNANEDDGTALRLVHHLVRIIQTLRLHPHLYKHLLPSQLPKKPKFDIWFKTDTTLDDNVLSKL